MPSIAEVLVEVVGDGRQAEATLNKVARQILSTGALTGEPEINLKGVIQARHQIRTLEATLERLDGMKVTPEVQVEVDAARARIAGLKDELASISQTIAAKGGVMNLNDRDANRLASVLRDLGREAGNVGRMFQQTGQNAENLNGQFRGFLGFVKQVNPIISGMSILLGTALVPGFLALGASIASAVGGLVLFANVLITTLGPGLLMAVAVFARLSAIMEAVQARKTAMAAKTRQSATAEQAAAQAADQRASAEEALRDALQSREAAERAVARAIQAARDALDDAQRRAGEAATRLRETTVDAYDAIRDAAERAEDAVLGLAQAQVDAERAKLNLKDARRDLADYVKGLGVADETFKSLMDRFTDVDFDTGGLREALLAAGVEGVDPRKQDELARKILDVKDAKLAVRRAIDAESDAERELGEARKENLRYQREGIRAYAPYIAALNDAREAQRDLTRLERQGINNAEGVIAAREALRDANERVVTAQRQVASSVRNAAASMRQAEGPMAQFKKLWGDLSEEEQRFAKLIIALPKELRKMAQEGTDALLSGLGNAFIILSTKAEGMTRFFTAAGQTWGGIFEDIAARLTDNDWSSAFEQLGKGFNQISEALGRDALLAFLEIMRNLAVVALPPVVQMLREFATWLQGIADSTDGVGNIANLVNIMVESFKTWMKFGGGLLDLILAVVEAAGPIGDELVGGLTDGMKALAKWFRSAEGQKEVKDFFEDTIPAVVAVGRFIGELVRLGIEGFRLFGPVIAGFFDGMSEGIAIIRSIVGWFNRLIDTPIGRAVRYAIGAFLGFGKVINIVRRLFTWGGKLLSKFKLVGKGGGAVTRALSRAWNWCKGKIVGAWSAISRRATTIWNGIKSKVMGPVRSATAWLKGRWEWVKSTAATAWNGILNKIGSIWRGIKEKIAGPVNRAIDWVQNAVTRFYEAGKSWVDSLWEGIKSKALWLYNKAKGIVDSVTSLLPGSEPKDKSSPMVGLKHRGEAFMLNFASGIDAGGSAVRRAAAREFASIPMPRVATAAAAGAAAGGGRGGINIEKVELPPAPAAAVPDARVQAAQLARELKRRGGR